MNELHQRSLHHFQKRASPHNSRSPIRAPSAQSNYLTPNNQLSNIPYMDREQSVSTTHSNSGRSTPIFGFGRKTPTLSLGVADAASSRSG